MTGLVGSVRLVREDVDRVWKRTFQVINVHSRLRMLD